MSIEEDIEHLGYKLDKVLMAVEDIDEILRIVKDIKNY